MRTFYIYFSFFIDCKKWSSQGNILWLESHLYIFLQIDSIHMYIKVHQIKYPSGYHISKNLKYVGSAILSTNTSILSALIWPQNFEKKKGLLIMNKNRSSKNCARVDFSVYVILSLFFCHVNFALVAGVRFPSTFFCHFYTHTQHIEIVLIWHPLLHFHYTIVGYATLCSI